ncbi:hypothetical protein [Amycolatopsis albispora]|uniref:Uncharacterized protein n=1 Tax=Amycolatopsis albispora TaxID=1804986 RepID=A0A344L3F8_9PSEU|nr:hypothetical protein [Amycolatopsis albispora]AXB42582.1 hypothetical protein A4R43_08605 [Amycolatopsis albispora]
MRGAPASGWRRRFGPAFVSTALADRAMWWSWQRCENGWAFEIAFRHPAIRDEFTGQPRIKAALDDAIAAGATVSVTARG